MIRRLDLGSCKSIQHYKRTRTDGEYKINIRGREVEIYCHNMNTDDPAEYVTLRKGNSENYALFYSKRSSDISRCENGKGVNDESIHYGTSTRSRSSTTTTNSRTRLDGRRSSPPAVTATATRAHVRKETSL
jgi:GON domain